MIRNLTLWLIAGVGFLVLLGAALVSPAGAEALFEEDFMVNTGYLRQYASVNLQDIPETLDDDQYALNMVRSQFLLDSDFDLAPWAQFNARLRTAREYETDYLENLQDPSELEPIVESPSLGVTIPRNGALGTDYYEEFVGENDLEIREMYLSLDLTDSMKLSAGKQMRAWGKGSFERALDLIHGFNSTWAPAVSSDEERRKSLLMLYLTKQYSAAGTLDVFYQPGWDDSEDIGNSGPSRGGRYTANGLRGLDVNRPLPIPPFNLGGAGSIPPGSFIQVIPDENPDHSAAAVDKEKFGLRYRGSLWSRRVEYSLAYLHTHQKSSASHNVLSPYRSDVIDTGDPRCEPNPALGGDLGVDALDLADDGSINNSIGCLESGNRRETFHPIIDVFGGSFNYYSPTLDVVTRGEIAYLKDRVFKRAPRNAVLRSLNDLFGNKVFKDPIEKNEYRLMLGIDRTAYFTTTLLGTDRPGLLVVEFFDFIIEDFEEDERIFDNTHVQGLKEHTLEAVVNLDWSYSSGYYNLGITGLFDLSYGGNMTLIPSIKVQPSTHWRVGLTGVFVPRHQSQGTASTTFGANGEADRITTEVTYQF